MKDNNRSRSVSISCKHAKLSLSLRNNSNIPNGYCYVCIYVSFWYIEDNVRRRLSSAEQIKWQSFIRRDFALNKLVWLLCEIRIISAKSVRLNFVIFRLKINDSATNLVYWSTTRTRHTYRAQKYHVPLERLSGTPFVHDITY